MLKMIIADDEKRVLQLIKNLVQWHELGIVNVGEADNGITAFELIMSQKPDIVIADIRMPGMDGLEIVRKTREMGLKTSFILVSGHKQFEYAQNALRYGVEDYLVKPINEQELNHILSKLRDQYLEERGRLENERLIKTQLERNREKLHLQFMRNLIFEPDRLKITNIAELNADYQFNFVNGYFQACALKIDRKFKDIDESHLNLMAEKIHEVIKHCLEENCVDFVSINNNAQIVCVANFETPDAISTKMSTLFDEARKHLDIHSYLVLTIGVSALETELQSIVRAVQSAMEAISARLVLGADRVIDGAALKFKTIRWQKILTPERESQFILLIEVLDSEAIRRWLDGIFAEIKARKNIHPRIFIEVSRQIFEVFLKAVKRLELEPESTPIENFVDQFDYAITVDELHHLLSSFIGDKLEAYLLTKRVQDAKPIRLAKQYISEHYQDAVSLEEVAGEIHLNPAYFSVVFKKEVGINFSDYLINFRIEKAKEFLKDTRYNMREIADMVGYKDAKYFSKLFRKIIGITPTEYRNLYS